MSIEEIAKIMFSKLIKEYCDFEDFSKDTGITKNDLLSANIIDDYVESTSDLKTDDVLIIYANQIKEHCNFIKQCEICPFYNKDFGCELVDGKLKAPAEWFENDLPFDDYKGVD